MTCKEREKEQKRIGKKRFEVTQLEDQITYRINKNYAWELGGGQRGYDTAYIPGIRSERHTHKRPLADGCEEAENR